MFKAGCTKAVKAAFLSASFFTVSCLEIFCPLSCECLRPICKLGKKKKSSVLSLSRKFHAAVSSSPRTKQTFIFGGKIARLSDRSEAKKWFEVHQSVRKNHVDIQKEQETTDFFSHSPSYTMNNSSLRSRPTKNSSVQ